MRTGKSSLSKALADDSEAWADIISLMKAGEMRALLAMAIIRHNNAPEYDRIMGIIEAP